jgi:hypothetical protein
MEMREFMRLLARENPDKQTLWWVWKWKLAHPRGTVSEFFLAQKAKGKDGEVQGVWGGQTIRYLYWCFINMLDYRGRKKVWNDSLHCRAINALARKCGYGGMYGMTRNAVAEALARAYEEEA